MKLLGAAQRGIEVADELHSTDLARKLAHIAQDLLAQSSLQQTLDQIVAHALALVPRCDGAAISVLRKGCAHALSVSDAKAASSVRIQGEIGEGPCLDLSQSGEESYFFTDLTSETMRWPDYIWQIRKLGINSIMGFKLFTKEENLGVLDLYAAPPGAFDEQSQEVGRLLASHATIAFSTARSNTNLRTALSSRQDVGMASGILMERHKISADEAFATLVKASQDSNIKLREIARRVVETGESPCRAHEGTVPHTWDSPRRVPRADR
jgi:transcriptional regulator with GAF, ATPase, and Fis domain